MITVTGRLSESRAYDSLLYVLDGKDDLYSFPSTLNTSFDGLYSSPYLPYGDHTLTVRLAANDSTLFIEGMNVTTPTEMATESRGVVHMESSQNHIPEIVGGTIGGAVGLILVLAVVFFYQRRKIRLAGKTKYTLVLWLSITYCPRNPQPLIQWAHCRPHFPCPKKHSHLGSIVTMACLSHPHPHNRRTLSLLCLPNPLVNHERTIWYRSQPPKLCELLDI